MISVAKPQGISSICLDPNPEAESQLFTTYSIDHVIKSLEAYSDTEIEGIIKNETEGND